MWKWQPQDTVVSCRMIVSVLNKMYSLSSRHFTCLAQSPPCIAFFLEALAMYYSAKISAVGMIDISSRYSHIKKSSVSKRRAKTWDEHQYRDLWPIPETRDEKEILDGNLLKNEENPNIPYASHPPATAATQRFENWSSNLLLIIQPGSPGVWIISGYFSI